MVKLKDRLEKWPFNVEGDITYLSPCHRQPHSYSSPSSSEIIKSVYVMSRKPSFFAHLIYILEVVVFRSRKREFSRYLITFWNVFLLMRSLDLKKVAK